MTNVQKGGKPDWQWVLGLSIDEKIQWGVALVDNNATFITTVDESYSGIFYEPLTELRNISDKINLQSLILSSLNELRKRPGLSELFDRVTGVGVSSIGIVDQHEMRVTGIARRNLLGDKSNSIINFNELFDRFFGRRVKINVNNAATAIAITESLCINTDDNFHQLCYVIFGEGVNCGLITGGIPVRMPKHPEAGHDVPAPHPHDRNFNPKHSGCPVHTYCYEGVASSARIRAEWHSSELYDLKDHKDKPWEIIGYYIAKLCYSAALMIPPDRILVGGSLVFPELIPEIRKQFRKMHEGNGDRPLLPFDDKRFIRLAKYEHHEAEVLGALELGRLAAKKLGGGS